MEVRKVAIVRGGLAKFGVRKATYKELAQEAGNAVFDDIPNLDKKDVDSLFLGSAGPDRFAFQCYPAPLVAEQVGVQPRNLIMRTELACASGQAAMRAAYASIAAGLSDIALVMGVEKMNTPNLAEAQTTMAAVMDREWDGVNGMSAPPFFAMIMQRHMYEYGTTREQIAKVSVKNHDNSASNPFAQFQQRFTIDDVIKSVEISKPIRLLDCSGITDGAAGIVMTTEEKAKEFTDTPVYIEGLGQCNMGSLVSNLPSLTTWESLKVAFRNALDMAGKGIMDMSFAEVHDCFTISEIVIYEDSGMCEKGQGGKHIEDGNPYVGGKLPVNTHGGLLGTGHPLGATSIAQTVEVIEQFRGEVPEERYVGGEWALTHNLSGNANVHSVLVMRRGG
ncbi:MAG: 3-ketoacyl-CoA thiolase [Methanobacteriota archaeon]|nr:MAG: 3-ketoacyl-CoA thiolase [Euryarchaeota archaeon]